ncbi:MAG TPA: hypothetical protein VGM35_07625, partial [Xanthobacteraceae bacterium]
ALHAAVTKALASPELREKFKKQTMEPAPQKSVEEAQKWLASEMKHWETITHEVKIDLAGQ